MKINIFKRSKKTVINKKNLTRLIKKIFSLEKGKKRCTELNVVITTDRHMKKLNRRHLHIDDPTNVIAFDLGEVAEVYVSADQAHDRYEMYFFIIHGILHLCGYRDHKRRDRDRIEARTRSLIKNV